ncbi:hypothetical protein SLEP1_g59500 [Rubroshorea leprosula]|uniref:Uncharacterized protein n=1 Tax=Rubroshorea leprosula TaxID=152421 RepID=A0AAV5MSK8_9ROSI|nr:hypothetical protein SLEP1_g59500 [Rubroshorea leprosula]
MTSIHIDPSKQPKKYKEKIKITGGVWSGRSESDLGYPTHGIAPRSFSSLPLHDSSIPHYLSMIPLRSSRSYSHDARRGGILLDIRSAILVIIFQCIGSPG